MKSPIPVIFSLVLMPAFLYPHCQVPCGIYDDAARIMMIKEHVRTIEKAMNQITRLSGNLSQSPTNYNQLVRWVNTKEDHARQIQEIVADYFLTQRVKAQPKGADGYDVYVSQTTVLHQLLVGAMKCRQTLELEHTRETLALVNAFVEVYFDVHGQEHLQELERN